MQINESQKQTEIKKIHLPKVNCKTQIDCKGLTFQRINDEEDILQFKNRQEKAKLQKFGSKQTEEQLKMLIVCLVKCGTAVATLISSLRKLKF